MTTSAPHATTDRSDFRTVMTSGTKVGLAIGVSVAVFLIASRTLPAGAPRDAVLTLVVLLAAGCASLLPAHWSHARGTEGVAGAAAIGLWGTVIFSGFDIILLRPFKAYPWTWDAVGGGSTWWYLPIWWMLGTFAAWMGGLLTAARNARHAVSVIQLAVPLGIAAIVIGIFARATGCPESLPVTTGAGYLLALVALTVFSITRKAG